MSKRHSRDRTEPERSRRVSVFVPAYNEAANLETALRDIVAPAEAAPADQNPGEIDTAIFCPAAVCRMLALEALEESP